MGPLFDVRYTPIQGTLGKDRKRKKKSLTTRQAEKPGRYAYESMRHTLPSARLSSFSDSTAQLHTVGAWGHQHMFSSLSSELLYHTRQKS